MLIYSSRVVDWTLQEKEEEDKIRAYQASVAAREGDVLKKKVGTQVVCLLACLLACEPGPSLWWCSSTCLCNQQEEKKAIQDAMLAKIVAEAKRKQAEEDEMRMVRTQEHPTDH